MCSGALLFFSHGQVRGGPVPDSPWGLWVGKGASRERRGGGPWTIPVAGPGRACVLMPGEGAVPAGDQTPGGPAEGALCVCLPCVS